MPTILGHRLETDIVLVILQGNTCLETCIIQQNNCFCTGIPRNMPSTTFLIGTAPIYLTAVWHIGVFTLYLIVLVNIKSTVYATI